jgi:flagellar FliL protein
MAKEAKSGVAMDTPKKSGKLLIIVGVLLALILVIGAAGAFFLMRSHGGEEGDEEEVVEPVKPKKKAIKEAPPVYVAMEAFTVNLAPESGEQSVQLVQLILSVEVADISADEQIKTYMPKIRHNVMMLLSSKKASELLTREGKEKLAVEIREQMNQALDPKARADDAPVKDVLLTSLIIQYQ